MKKLLFIFVLAIFIGCQVSDAQNSPEYNAVYEKGDLKVYNQKKLVDKIKLSGGDDFRIDQKNLNGLFFFAFYAEATVEPSYIGLCNTSDGKWIVKINPNDNKDYMLPNIDFMGSCHHNSYLLFEGGTGVEQRDIKVITSSGKVNHVDTYYANFKEPVWNESRMAFEYYKIAETVPPNMPKFTGNNNSWVRKYLWKQGKVQATDEYEQTFRM